MRPAGAGLRRHQRLAQQSGCVQLGLLRSGCLADAAAFAAPAGVNLGLYYCFAAQLFRHGARLRGTERYFALRHRDAVAGKNLLGLILVNLHANPKRLECCDGSRSGTTMPLPESRKRRV